MRKQLRVALVAGVVGLMGLCNLADASQFRTLQHFPDNSWEICPSDFLVLDYSQNVPEFYVEANSCFSALTPDTLFRDGFE